MGLDIGTTGTKAVIFDEEGKILSQSYREYTLLKPNPGWLELDPAIVWESVQTVIREAVKENKGSPVRAMATSALGEAVTPIDKEGNPLYNTVIAMDIRAIPQSEWLGERLGKKRLFEITGMPLHPMYSINKILWFKENIPDVYNNTWKFLCWEDLFSLRLGLKPVIDYSLASRTMAFDIVKKRWSEEIMEVAGLEGKQFAEARPSGYVIGEIPREIAESLGLKPGVVVTTGGFDQPCAALGAGAVKEGMAVVGTGTVECATPALNEPILNDRMLAGNYPCACHVKDDMFVTLAFNFTGGALLRWYRDNFGAEEIATAKEQGRDVYEVMIERAGKEPSPVFIVPHYMGTGTPWIDPRAKGAFLGLTLATTKKDIIKGMLDGITYELKLNLDTLEKAGVKVEQLRAIGGGAKSREWLQLKADITDKKIVSLNVTEAGCLATAILAGKGIGIYSTVDSALERIIEEKEVFTPDPERHQKYLERYNIYSKIYPTISELSHKIG